MNTKHKYRSDFFSRKTPEEKVKICEEFLKDYPEDHPEAKKIQEQINRYKLLTKK